MSTAMDNLGAVRRCFNTLGRSGFKEMEELIYDVADPGVFVDASGLGGKYEGREPAEGWIDVIALIKEIGEPLDDYGFAPSDVQVIHGAVIHVICNAVIVDENGERQSTPFSSIFVFDEGLIGRLLLRKDTSKAEADAKAIAQEKELADEDPEAAADA